MNDQLLSDFMEKNQTAIEELAEKIFIGIASYNVEPPVLNAPSDRDAIDEFYEHIASESFILATHFFIAKIGYDDQKRRFIEEKRAAN